jgi:hypothetical protein
MQSRFNMRTYREDDHKAPRPLVRSLKREGFRESAEQGGWSKVRPDEDGGCRRGRTPATVRLAPLR